MNQFQFAEAYTELSVKDSKFRQTMRTVHGDLVKLKGTMESVGRVANRMFIASAAAMTYFIKKASDAEEIASKFNAVFKEGAERARKWVEAYSDAIGRSKYDLQSYMSSFQDTFVPLGFARDKAAELSKQLTTLGLDLASFNNAAEPETMQLLASALVGNHEAVRRFGIVLTEASVKQQLLKDGFKGNVQQASNLQKVMARLAIIMESTTDAQGDAMRTANSMANQWRRFKSQVTELAVELGKVFIPMVKRATAGLADLVEQLKRMPSASSEAITSWVALAAGIGGVSIVLPRMLTGVTGLAAALGGGAGLTGSVMGLVGALGLLAAAFINAEVKGLSFKEGAADMLDTLAPGTRFANPRQLREQQAAAARESAKHRTWEGGIKAALAGKAITPEERKAIREKYEEVAKQEAELQRKYEQLSDQERHKRFDRPKSYPAWMEKPDPVTGKWEPKTDWHKGSLKNFFDFSVARLTQHEIIQNAAYDRYLRLKYDTEDARKQFQAARSRRQAMQPAFEQFTTEMNRRAHGERVTEMMGRLFPQKWRDAITKERDSLDAVSKKFKDWQEKQPGMAGRLFDWLTGKGGDGEGGLNEKLAKTVAALLGPEKQKQPQLAMPSAGGGQFMGFAELHRFMQGQVTRGEQELIQLGKQQLEQQQKMNESLEKQAEHRAEVLRDVWGE